MHTRSITALGVALFFAICTPVQSQQRAVRINNTYWYSGGAFHWKLFVDEGPALLRAVKCVRYELYPTFPSPVRQVCDASNGFALVESGQSEFKIAVKIEWADGETSFQSYMLDLHSGDRKDPSLGMNRNESAPALSRLPGSGDPLLQGFQPVALSVVRSGGLVIADGARQQLTLWGPDGLKPLGPRFSHDMLMDMSSGATDEGELIFVVTDPLRSDQLPTEKIIGPIHGPGAVTAYSMSGQRLNSWTIPTKRALVACAFDNEAQFLYVLSDRGEIYRLNPRSSESPRLTVDIPVPGEKPFYGLIAGDAHHNRLLVAAQDSRDLYQVDLAERHIARLSLDRSFANLRALVVSPSGDRIYVADGRRIWVVRQLYTNPAEVNVFSDDPRLRSVSALAVGSDNYIWAGDQEAHAIYRISPKGQGMAVLSEK